MKDKKIKVLIIEDDRDLAQIYSLKLKSEGFEIAETSDGAVAIETIKKEKPDIVLLDLVLPNMDGYTILDKMRKDPELKNTSVFVWSNLTQENEIQKAKKLAINEYLIKSDYTPTTLAKKLFDLIKNKK